MLNFITTLIECSLSMSIIALVFMLINSVINTKYSAKLRYYAWLIVLIGLVIPFRPDSSNSLITIKQIASHTQSVQSPVIIALSEDYQRFPTMNAPYKTNSEVQLSQGVTPNSQLTAKPISSIEPIVGQINPDINNDRPNISIIPSITTDTSTTSAGIPLFLIWVIGFIANLIYRLYSHFHIYNLIKRWSHPNIDQRINDVLNRLRLEMGIKQNLHILMCPISLVSSPMIRGITKPTILLPDIEFSDNELYFILKHELVHFQQHDIYFKLLMLIALCVHWFNPIIYLMSRAISIQCEQACDETVLKSADIEQRIIYSHTLINLSAQPILYSNSLSTSFYGGKKGIKKRLVVIFDEKRKKKGFVVLCILISITVMSGTVFSFSSPLANNDEKKIKLNLNGRNIRILNTTGMSGMVEDVLKADTSPSAPYELAKVQKIQKDYNCTLEYISDIKKVSDSISLGEPLADLYMMGESMAELSIACGNDGWLQSLDPYSKILELDNSTIWNTEKQKMLTFGGNTQVLCNNNTYENFFNNDVMFFNKTMLIEAGLWDKYNLYEMQMNKTWNWDTFKLLCNEISKPVNDFGYKSHYGISFKRYILNDFAISNGNGDNNSSLVTLNSEGKAIFDLYNPSKKAALDLFIELSLSDSLSPIYKDYVSQDDVLQSFINGNELFLVEKGSVISNLVNSLEDEWGVVSIPYGPNNRKQDYYITDSNPKCIGIIKNAKETEELAHILREFAPAAVSSSEMIPLISKQLSEDNRFDESVSQTYEMLTQPAVLRNDFARIFLDVAAVTHDFNAYTPSLFSENDFYDSIVPKTQKSITSYWDTIMTNIMKSKPK